MNIKHIVTIWKKEIRDTVRDRRTLVSMVLIPILLMPVILLGMFKLIQAQEKSMAEKTVKLAVVNAAAAPEIVDALAQAGRIEIVPVEGDVEAAVAEEKVDAALRIPADFSAALAGRQPAELELLSKSTNLNAANIRVGIAASVEAYNRRLIADRLGAAGLDASILSPVTLVNRDAATSNETSGFFLGLIIPLFIVIYSITGGQYTAIDVSAGEKERKTLEALLLTPVKRVDIVLGKFLAVTTVALTSIVLAIGSLYATFVAAGRIGVPLSANAASASAGAGMGALQLAVEPLAAVLLFAVSVFLVLLFSAVILSISIYAKSFKEAESYIGPAYMLVVLPIVFINSVPTFEPTLGHFAIPAVNAVLLFKEVLMGTYDPGHIGMTFLSLAVAAALAIVAATRIYSREKVLFND